MSLWNRNFLLLWQGQFVSQVGSQAYFIAMVLWVKHLTGSASAVGLLLMASQIPVVLLSPFGGSLADRYSRRGIIIISDVARGLVVLTLAGLMFWTPDAHGLLLASLFVVAATLAAVSAVFQPAAIAAIPDIVPHDRVIAANSMNSLSSRISGLVGNGAGGVLYRLLGAPVLFLADGVSYLLSALSEWFIEIPQKREPERLGARQTAIAIARDTREGLGYLWRRLDLRNFALLITVMSFLFSSFVVLLPFLVEDTFGATADWFGYLMAGLGAGNMVGFAVAGGVRIPGPLRGRLLIGAMIGVSLSLAGLGVVDSPGRALALVVVMGIFIGFWSVSVISNLQLSTPAELRGRVFGVTTMLTDGATPIAYGLAGVVADLVDQQVPSILLACGVIMALVSASAAWSREIRRFLAFEP